MFWTFDGKSYLGPESSSLLLLVGRSEWKMVNDTKVGIGNWFGRETIGREGTETKKLKIK
jgi:hypothetical protein